jgi:hypothetical protein
VTRLVAVVGGGRADLLVGSKSLGLFAGIGLGAGLLFLLGGLLGLGQLLSLAPEALRLLLSGLLRLLLGLHDAELLHGVDQVPVVLVKGLPDVYFIQGLHESA